MRLVPKKKRWLLIAAAAALLLAVIAVAHWLDRSGTFQWRGHGTGYHNATTRSAP